MESVVSAHVRYPSREGVADALVRLGVGRGVPVPVWPPRALPHGLFVSPVRGGWVSIWSPVDDLRQWFPKLTGTLECPGAIFEAPDGCVWYADLFQDSTQLAEMELPLEAIAAEHIIDSTREAMRESGVDMDDDSDELEEALQELLGGEEHRQLIQELVAALPNEDLLRPFVPPHASLAEAWKTLLFAGEAFHGEEPPEGVELLDRFAAYIGIRDAAWNPAEDAEALSEGDYDDGEGLPESWREFIVVPAAALPMLG